jgi:acetylornithine deacetylase/succinyl-diaminopimelate desuccinylase family protein
LALPADAYHLPAVEWPSLADSSSRWYSPSIQHVEAHRPAVYRGQFSVMALDLVDTLSQLVAIPSVNPMGRAVSGPEYFEYRVTDWLQQLFERWSLPWQRQTVDTKRDNIIARFDGDPTPADGGKIILFEAHQDTVPVDGMTIDPWQPTVRDGRLYGRGSCDIKGGMTAMLGAVARLMADAPRRRPTVIMACTVNEEHGYSGASALTRLWTSSSADSIIPRAPDAAVIAEPTNLDVVVAHKGAVRWRCHTHGRAAHSSQPQLGDNAIYKMARVVAALESYARDVPASLPAHPLCGRASLSVGLISGGLSVNTVPARATIEIDRRIIPGEDGEAAYRQVIDYVAHRTELGTFVEHERPYLEGRSLNDGPNNLLASRLVAAARTVHGQAAEIGVPFGTDAATIAAAGVPSVVFGPGSIAQAHTADEWLSLDELSQASEVLYRFLAESMNAK